MIRSSKPMPSRAGVVLDVIRSLEQPLILAFNRGRLMVLPPGIAKSIGLARVLSTLRLSIHNTIGIGDAENDHDLLDACEVGVAVEWGSPALRVVADEVIAGTGPPAVAAYLRGLTRQLRLSAEADGPSKTAARPPARWPAGSPGDSRPHGAHRRRTGFRQVVAGRAALRAADSAGLLSLHHRSGRRLSVARSAAGSRPDGRRRTAASCPRARRRRCATPTSAS